MSVEFSYVALYTRLNRHKFAILVFIKMLYSAQHYSNRTVPYEAACLHVRKSVHCSLRQTSIWCHCLCLYV